MSEREAKAAAWELAGQLREARAEAERQREIAKRLDALVSRFCVAAGEPVPVDAIERIKRLREALRRLIGAVTAYGEASIGTDEADALRSDMFLQRNDARAALGDTPDE